MVIGNWGKLSCAATIAPRNDYVARARATAQEKSYRRFESRALRRSCPNKLRRRSRTARQGDCNVTSSNYEQAEHCDGQTVAYLWNLAVDCEAQRQYEWALPDGDFLSYLGAKAPDLGRLQRRGATLGRYLQDPKSLAFTRAQTGATKEYFRLKDGGATHEAAETGALARFRQLVEGLGISIDEFSVTIRSSE